jgi:hypothetical protein
MALRARTFPTAALADLGATNTTPANTLVPASATLTRYLRSMHVTNSTAGALAWNFGIGTAAILTATNSMHFGQALAANATFDRYWGGKGHRVDNQTIMGFASAAGVKFELNYDESDALDA